MIDTKKLIEEVFILTKIRTVVADTDNAGSVVLVSCEQGSTDAIRLNVDKNNLYIEIFPAEITGEEIVSFEHETLESACAVFLALHTYRNLAVKPFLLQVCDMI